MARNTTLVKLLDDLRAEARVSLNPAHNTQNRAVQVKALQREQERLWEEHDWPQLRVTRQVPVQAGERYYAPPDDLTIDRIEKIEIFRDGGWFEMRPGIDAEHYTAWNSDLDERSWPPRRWKIHEDGTVEVWPISDVNGDPATREGYLKFTGIRNLRPLVADDDRADLDDLVLVLFVAGGMLAASGAKDAQLKLDKAQARLTRLTSNLKPRRQVRMFGIGEPKIPQRILISQYRPPSN
ncbi:hypothetical protein [Nitratireductor soli]|uniref:phage adaptor protein n=1 Tax=Nitratireductor soli TaxID=1670619 RepID=UPI00065E3178|nr:hypothetical protein [Nitratireductor soli]